VDGETWSSSFPDGFLVAGSSVDFYVRVNPDSMVDADDGSYEYDFLMAGAAGGLSLLNSQRDMAHVTGTTPADQVGLTLNIECSVIDSAGNSMDSAPISGDWQ